MTPSVERKILGEVRMLMERESDASKHDHQGYQDQIDEMAGRINRLENMVEGLMEAGKRNNEPGSPPKTKKTKK